MARRKQAPKDLTGIRQRGGTYQVRLFGGLDPVTGKQVMLTGSAEDEDAAIKIREVFRRQVADATAARTSVTLGYLLDQWLADHQVEETTRTSYRVAIEKFIKPAVGDTSLTRLAQLGARPFEQLYAELRVCRRRCKGRTFIEHRTHRAHECDERCMPHTCRPLSVSSVRECHAVLSGALSAAMRWGWIAVNPLEAVKRPRQQHPQPDPPSPEEAARIVSAAWEQDADWGAFVWLTFITGARRGELLGLAWEHLDLSAGLLTIRRNLVRQNGEAIIKDTKTHRMRVVSLDPDTVAILTSYKQRAQRRCTELGTTLGDDAFVFSYAPDHRRHCDRHCCVGVIEGGQAGLMRRRPARVSAPRSGFSGFRFPPEVITLAVRWYLRFGLSYRDVEELLAERGIDVDHVSVYRWVQRFTPLLIDAARPCRHAPGDRWFVDETYVKVAGRWVYLYRAIDQFGQVIDVLVAEKRDLAATRRFFTQALDHGTCPAEVSTDRAPDYPRVLDELLPSACHVTEQYANDAVEADHGRLKSRLRPMRGLKRLRSARVICTGHAFVQNLRRGHYELAVDLDPTHRIPAVFAELALAI